ncbi:MAG: IPTL-CTERM sorting domain-containing protein [Phycisphaerales bacterium]|nr:MAG: IPTL-CTERM sorting domain-containing protein [Phycisphaerales bacterium]
MKAVMYLSVGVMALAVLGFEADISRRGVEDWWDIGSGTKLFNHNTAEAGGMSQVSGAAKPGIEGDVRKGTDGGRRAAVSCSSDTECADGRHCNGEEICSGGVCQEAAVDACEIGNLTCDESTGTCLDRSDPCDLSTSVSRRGLHRYDNATATAEIEFLGRGQVAVEFTGWIVNEHLSPYIDTEGRPSVDWRTKERHLTADTPLGPVTIVMSPEHPEEFTAVGTGGCDPTPTFGCYGGMFGGFGCNLWWSPNGGAPVALFPEDGLVQMEAKGEYPSLPVTGGALFSLANPPVRYKNAAGEFIFQLNSLTLNTGLLTTGACTYDDGTCLNLPEFSCDNATQGGGTYHGDGTACEDIIPTVSEWGIVILALLLLVGGKLLFDRRRAIGARAQ